MESEKPALVICAPQYGIAKAYALHKGLAKGTFKVAVWPHELRGLSPDLPVIVVDTWQRWPDHAELMHLLHTRFRDVRHDTY